MTSWQCCHRCGQITVSLDMIVEREQFLADSLLVSSICYNNFPMPLVLQISYSRGCIKCEVLKLILRSPIQPLIFLGQNLGLGHQSWSQVLNSWWNEITEFRYNRPSEMVFSRVGHFTQMAWANSAKVGCGWATCTNPDMMRFSGGRYFVCNYGSA